MAALLNKTAFITGASSGIGAAVARRFAREGATLVLSGRNTAALQAVADQCAATPGAAQTPPLCLPADLSKESEVSALCDAFLGQHSSLDVLVNNAGVLETGALESANLEQFDRVMQVNVRAVFEMTRRMVPALEKCEGNVVNVSSVNGVRAFPGLQAYNISKAALDQFTRCTALELASKNIRVNSVNPGVIITELQKRGGLNKEQYEQFLERAKATHALGRPGEAEEVAEAVLFLGDAARASFITAVCLPVDGGRHAMCPR